MGARGETQKYYREFFRQRELARLEAAPRALAQGDGDADELAPSATRPMGDGHDPEASRAMQLTGLQINDPFLASANARFQARLEARDFGGGARRLSSMTLAMRWQPRCEELRQPRLLIEAPCTHRRCFM